MSWNYRVIRHRQASIAASGDAYTIHEVFYDKRGKIDGWSDAMHPLGETISELRSDMRYMSKALKLPVLEIKNNKLVPIRKESK